MWTLLKRLLLIGSASGLAVPAPAQTVPEEHALIITTVDVKVTPGEIFAIEDELTKAFAPHSVGVVDGNEIAVDGSEAMIFAYGPDAEAMFATALPVLRSYPATKAGLAMLRFGSVSNPKARVDRRVISDPQWNQ